MQGKIFSQHIAVVFGLGYVSLFFNVGISRAYDRPDFKVSVIEKDGLSATEAELDAIVVSLVTIAAAPDADSDLKEKALGIALRLDPMNAAARAANTALIQRAKPAAMENSANPAAVSEALWQAGVDLLKTKPSPADAALAPYLMEISLTVSPRPSGDDVWRLAQITDGKIQEWEKFLQLQPQANPSNKKVAKLFASLKRQETKQKNRKRPAPVIPIEPKPKAAAPKPTTTDGTAISPIKISSGEIAFVYSTSTGPVPVVIKMEIREPTADESSLFTEKGSNEGSFQMKVWPKPGKVNLGRLKQAGETAKKYYPHWPDNKVAEMSLNNPAGEPLEIKGVREIDAHFPVYLLLMQAFSGEVLSQEFMYIQKANSESSTEMEAAMSLAQTKAIILNKEYPKILENASLNNDVSPFAKIHLIGVPAHLAVAKIFRGNSKLPIEEAITEFDAIIAKKSPTMSINDYARNKAVANLLDDFTAKYPFHLSAKVMMELSATPKPATTASKPEPTTTEPKPTMVSKTDPAPPASNPKTPTQQTFTSIDSVLEPLLNMYYKMISGRNVEFHKIDGKIRNASDHYRFLRKDLPSDATRYLRLAEDILPCAEKYLTTKNKTTSTGAQRHRELRAAIAALNAEREKWEWNHLRTSLMSS